ncbi:MAG TPA: serine hydrolase domain-containing protein [Acidobacteriota bacterium]|nr:serine hydrolase domain-containing protein [Acidobacteriota bacterium]
MQRFRMLMIGWVGLWVWMGQVLACQEEVDLTAQLEDSMSLLGGYGFSGTVLVAMDGEVLLHRGYGWARRDPVVAMQPETRFPVASISKQFTAAAVLKLEEEGKLRASDPISRHLDGVAEDKESITIRQLLSHTSGLPFECGGRPDSMQALLQCLWQAPPGEPGQAQYSNAGYALLAHLVEQVSGQPFKQFVRSRLFQPAAMSESGFIDEPQRFAQGQVAYQYTWNVEHGTEIGSGLNWNLRGSADVVTTAGDLLRWERALTSGKILKADALKKLLQGDGEPGTAAGSGYGWQTDPGGQVQRAGGTFALGFNAVLRRYPSRKAVAVVLSNQNYGLLMPTPLVAETVENLLMGRPPADLPQAAAPPEDLLQQCAGDYQIEDGGRLQVEAFAGNLLISVQGQPAVNWLTVRSAPEARQLQAYTDRALELADALEKRRFGQIAEILGLDEGAEARTETLYRGWIEGLEDGQGQLQSVQVAGTIPQGESSRTYLRLTFEKGSQVRRLRWLGQDLVSIVPGALPLLPTHFRLLSGDKLAGFHLAYGRAVELRIMRDAEGRVSGLELSGPDGKLVALRR